MDDNHMNNLSTKEIEDGLTHKDPWTRSSFVKRTDYTPTAAQIESGLTDENQGVCSDWIERTDYTPTDAQVERGLADDRARIKEAWKIRMRKTVDAALYSPEEDDEVPRSL